MTKRLLYVTGTRADYSPMRSLLGTLAGDREFELNLIVTGMHLMSEYGRTLEIIEADGLRILTQIPMLESGDAPTSMVAAMANLMRALVKILADERPDGLMVTGDRGEMLAASICGAHLNIPVLHFCGGSVSGSIDDSIRHAITRFAHLHFPATKQSLDNLIRMGEDPKACFLVGLPGADLLSDAVLAHSELERILGFGLDDKYVVILQHPVIFEYEQAGEQIAATIEATLPFGLQTIVFTPNSDSGSQAMVNAISLFRSSKNRVHVIDNLPRQAFASLLLNCAALIGNSSCGVAEAVSLGIPVVNIGTRQRGRERMGNTIDVGYCVEEIRRGIHQALHSEAYLEKLTKCHNNYLVRGTEQRTLDIIKELDLQSFVPKRQLWPGTVSNSLRRESHL